MIRKATRRSRGVCVLLCALLGAALCALPAATGIAVAGDAAAAANDLSNRAFALLDSLNARDAEGAASPVLGQVASFAGDAQSLSQSLGKGDKAGARSALVSLQSDAAKLDAALRAHPGAIKSAQWDSMKRRLAALAVDIPHVSAPAGPEPSAASRASAPAAPAAGDTMVEASAPKRASEAPRIKIESRTIHGDITRVKGFFEGADLKAAGIYEGSRRVKTIKVEHVMGLQKVEFDLAMRDADVETNIRVVDYAGRKAIAPVFGRGLTKGNEVDGVEVERGTGATVDEGRNTVEIPSHRTARRGSKAPDFDGSGLGGGGPRLSRLPLGNVQIDITGVNEINAIAHIYRIAGQIAGRGVRRAGIYVDGRLVKRLPVSSASFNNGFDTTFIMNGVAATIRAFGAGNQYVEASVSMPSAGTPPVVVVPYAPNPYVYSPLSPYAVNPYAAAPYGIRPYGINPYGYGVNPYRYGPYVAPVVPANPAPINPYGNVPPQGAAGR